MLLDLILRLDMIHLFSLGALVGGLTAIPILAIYYRCFR